MRCEMDLAGEYCLSFFGVDNTYLVTLFPTLLTLDLPFCFLLRASRVSFNPSLEFIQAPRSTKGFGGQVPKCPDYQHQSLRLCRSSPYHGVLQVTLRPATPPPLGLPRTPRNLAQSRHPSRRPRHSEPWPPSCLPRSRNHELTISRTKSARDSRQTSEGVPRAMDRIIL